MGHQTPLPCHVQKSYFGFRAQLQKKPNAFWNMLQNWANDPHCSEVLPRVPKGFYNDLCLHCALHQFMSEQPHAWDSIFPAAKKDLSLNRCTVHSSQFNSNCCSSHNPPAWQFPPQTFWWFLLNLNFSFSGVQKCQAASLHWHEGRLWWLWEGGKCEKVGFTIFYACDSIDFCH